MSNEEVLVPLIVFASIVTLVGLILTYQLIKKRTFLKFLERHAEMTPESIHAIGRLFFTSHNDLRKGVFLLVTALAIWGFSLMVDFAGGNIDLNAAINGIALFPCFAGIAYLVLAYLSRE
ncbi:hypothetical protein J6I90_00980 [Pseudidiomarina sp. 1APP75-32.1]|uniref:DUF3784 domain-containing protein n=1 Tax=Pseudidiomarina terrestris TaxID=2820060 RepID=A0AAW7QY12_9GAMM|nr:MULTISPECIES: hypothetical protein [unclassified Pseudidiomarina]MDN7123451.1 hypothetical protein [Pseudidiomarina sp. 1APP75-32.1]MDN7128824.1 hypothetical protein [Pseudidiomarina sp. 1APR75-15]